MDKLWKFLRSKVTRVEKSPAETPFLHENIDMNKFPLSDYYEWKDNQNHVLIKQRLRQAYFNFITGGDAMDRAFEFYDTPISKGVVLFHLGSYNLKNIEYKYFQHYIHLLLKEDNYILKLSDIRSQQKGNWVESVYRYYLKPSVRRPLVDGKSDQIYGNVSLEFITRDDKAYMFRLIANTYQDQNFHLPKPFSLLIEKIST